MKKFLKGCFITAGILILIGIMMTIICVSFGGGKVFWEAVKNNEFSLVRTDLWNGAMQARVRIDDKDFDWCEDFDDFDDWNLLNGELHKSGNQEQVVIGSKEEVSSLTCEIGAAQFEILESPDDNYRLDYNIKNKLGYRITEGKLTIRGVEKNVGHNDKIYLYVPKDTVLDAVWISLGAGKAEVRGLKCKELIADIGAGKIDFINMETGDTDINVGAGQIDFEGRITGDINANCAMGQIDIEVKGNESFWNYDLNCAAGQIEINDREYSGLLNDVYTDNNAENECALDCAMGQIEFSCE